MTTTTAVWMWWWMGPDTVVVARWPLGGEPADVWTGDRAWFATWWTSVVMAPVPA